MTRLRFRPDIEGLRGVAILLVVAYHVGIPGFSGGFVGVDVFFTLSGYLITQLLLQELDGTGRVSLLAFYARRMRRLLPAAALAILGTLLLSVLVYPPSRVVDVAMEGAAAAVSVSNLLFSSQALDYFRDHTPSPLLHTWSLAVEEQFYLAWPLLVLLAAGRRADRARLGAVLTLLILVSIAFCWWWTIAERPVAFYGTPHRGWEFAVGGLAALVPNNRQQQRWAQPVAAAVSWVGMAAIAFAAVSFTDFTPFPGLSAAIPVTGAALVLVSARVPGAANAGRALAGRHLQWLGRHSYSWYLWHWPLLVFGAVLLPDGGLAAKVGLGAGALLIAVASLRFVEEPARRGRLLHAPPPRGIGVGAAFMVTVVLLAFGVHRLGEAAVANPEQAAFTDARTDFPQCRHAPVESQGVEVCRAGAKEPTRTIALFGDSHAAHWGPAFAEIALREGWELLVIAKALCPPVVSTIHEPSLGREYHECRAWRAAVMDTLRSRRPALVVLASTSEYVVGAPRPSPRSRIPVSEWEAGLARTVSELLAIGAQVALIAETPRAPRDVPDCLTLATWRRQDRGMCDFPVEGAVHRGVAAAELRMTQRFGNVRRLELTDAICGAGECRVWNGSRVLYRDTNHLTAAAARGLAPAVAPYFPP